MAITYIILQTCSLLPSRRCSLPAVHRASPSASRLHRPLSSASSIPTATDRATVSFHFGISSYSENALIVIVDDRYQEIRDLLKPLEKLMSACGDLTKFLTCGHNTVWLRIKCQ